MNQSVDEELMTMELEDKKDEEIQCSIWLSIEQPEGEGSALRALTP